jgi:hypothetical protein
MNSYSLILALSASLGLWLAIRRVPPTDIPRRIDEGFLLLAAALVGARLDYTLQHHAYYAQHIGEAFAFWQGGLGWLGAVFGGVLALAVLTALKRRSLAKEADLFLPLLPTLAIGAWLGCWSVGTAPGADRLIPLQLLAAVSLIAGFLTLPRLLPQPAPAGLYASAAFALFAVLQFGFDFRRVDSRPPFLHMPVDRWGALFLLIFSLGVLVWRVLAWWQTRPTDTHQH